MEEKLVKTFSLLFALYMILAFGLTLGVRRVYANEPPVAALDKSEYIGDEGQTMVFSADASYDPEGQPLHFQWDLENNDIWTSWSENSVMTYVWYDEYSNIVRVKVSDGVLEDIAEANVTIRNVAPEVNFGASPNWTFVGLPVCFSGDYSDPGIYDGHYFNWTFGDGNSSAGEYNIIYYSIIYRYSSPGVYSVNLTVTDDDGGQGTAMTEVEIFEMPTQILESCDKLGNQQDVFDAAQHESVFIKGTGFTPNTEFPVYVLHGIAWYNGSLIPGSKWASGAMAHSDANGTITPMRIWATPTIADAGLYGLEYVIIADINSNGVFEIEIDAIDNFYSDPPYWYVDLLRPGDGIVIIPEFLLGTILAFMSTSFGAALAHRVYKRTKENPSND